jgi:hypothetical protein
MRRENGRAADKRRRRRDALRIATVNFEAGLRACARVAFERLRARERPIHRAFPRHEAAVADARIWNLTVPVGLPLRGQRRLCVAIECERAPASRFNPRTEPSCGSPRSAGSVREIADGKIPPVGGIQNRN